MKFSKGSYCEAALRVRRRIGRGKEETKGPEPPPPLLPAEIVADRPFIILIGPEDLGDGAGCSVFEQEAAVKALVVIETVNGDGGRGLSGRSRSTGDFKSLELTMPTARPTAVELTVNLCGDGGVMGSNAKAVFGTVTVLTHFTGDRLALERLFRTRPPKLRRWGARRYESIAFLDRRLAEEGPCCLMTTCEVPGFGRGVFWFSPIISASISGSSASRIFEKETRMSTSDTKFKRRQRSFPRSVRQLTCSRIRPRTKMLISITSITKIDATMKILAKKFGNYKANLKIVNIPSSLLAGGIFDENIFETAVSNFSTKVSRLFHIRIVYKRKINIRDINKKHQSKNYSKRSKTNLFAALNDLNCSIKTSANDIDVFSKLDHASIQRLVILANSSKPPIRVIANFFEHHRGVGRWEAINRRSFSSKGFFQNPNKLISVEITDLAFAKLAETFHEDILPRISALVSHGVNFPWKNINFKFNFREFNLSKIIRNYRSPRNWVIYRSNSLEPSPAGVRPPATRSVSCTLSSAYSCQLTWLSPTKIRGRAWTTTGFGTAVVAQLIISTSSFTNTDESLPAESRTCLSVEKICITASLGADAYEKYNFKFLTLKLLLKNKQYKTRLGTYKFGTFTELHSILGHIISWSRPLSNALVSLLRSPHKREFSKLIYQKHRFKKSSLLNEQKSLSGKEKIADFKCKMDKSRMSEKYERFCKNKIKISLRRARKDLSGKPLKNRDKLSRQKLEMKAEVKNCGGPLITIENPRSKTPELRRDKKIEPGKVWETEHRHQNNRHEEQGISIYAIFAEPADARRRIRQSSRKWVHKHQDPLSPMYSSISIFYLLCTDTHSTAKTQK